MIAMQNALKQANKLQKSGQKRQTREEKEEVTLSDSMFLLEVHKQTEPGLQGIAMCVAEQLKLFKIDEYTLAIAYGKSKITSDFKPIKDLVIMTRDR